MIGQTVCSGIPLVRNIGRKWEMSSESVRAGLSLSCSTGEISGIPTRASLSVTYSITARNDVGSASGEVSLEVIPCRWLRFIWLIVSLWEQYVLEKEDILL